MRTLIRKKRLPLLLIYGWNLLGLLGMLLSGQFYLMLLGLFSVACFRLSLWVSPLLLTAAAWLPPEKNFSAGLRCGFWLLLLLAEGGFYAAWYCLTGSFY